VPILLLTTEVQPTSAPPSAQGCGPIQWRTTHRGRSNKGGTQEMGGPASASKGTSHDVNRGSFWPFPHPLPPVTAEPKVRKRNENKLGKEIKIDEAKK